MMLIAVMLACATVGGCGSSSGTAATAPSSTASSSASTSFASIASRCDAFAATHKPTGRRAGTTRATVGELRSDLARLHLAMPAQWENATDTDLLALAEYAEA